jgi:hypothetical protein
MRCATTGGTIWTLIMITSDKNQIYMKRYIITVIVIVTVTTSEVILFHAGISALEKEVRFIFENPVYFSYYYPTSLPS